MTPRRPVRVCLVGPSLDILGGQAIAAQRLLERLRTVPGLEVSFLPVNPRLPGPLRLLQRVKYVRTVVTSIAYISALLWRTWRYDVLHVFSASYWSFLLAPTPAILIGRLFGKPVVLNYRSGEADDHLARHGRVAIPILRLATVIVVPSGYLVGIFARHGLTATVILNFIELDRFRFRPRGRPRPALLANRNFEELYGVDDVIRAFGLVQSAWPDAHLVLVGGGSRDGELRELTARLGLRHVDFAGQIPPGEMPARFDAADIYVNASRIDNMPQSILEAYAAGTPVVTTDAGGIPFIATAERTALMVPVHDWQALGQAVLRLLNDGDLAGRIAQAAHDECVFRYSGTSIAAEWRALYESLARSNA
ncbi:MAG TPA: glycosyltransferase family 4 protein [Gemmatimonadales bacterium]|nr:glycosyltransferase family 4 protein [Gemmatimonadales bacterium]